MEDHGRHTMAAQQAAAKDYEPVYEGPPVGEKTSIDAITHEYAKADPVYVEKTLTLPATYTHYRPIRGDGNCGWRAIGFAYFEKLIEMGDQARIEGETARLISLHSVMASLGGYDYYEDFAEEVIGLLRDVAARIADPADALEYMHAKWNDRDAGPSIIYYLRLLAATWLKMNESSYAAFIPNDMGVQGYCSQSIELPDREIEHIGVDALASVLLKPLDVVLEVAYLDRTPGSQVNRYRVPGEANDHESESLGRVVYLLFRPDHYDILYRDLDPILPASVNMPQGNVTMQVNRVNGLTHNTAITSTQNDLGAFATMDFHTLSMIPGFGPTVSGMGTLASPALVAGPANSEPFYEQQGDISWTAAGPYARPVCPPHPEPDQAPRTQPNKPQVMTSLMTPSSNGGTPMSPNGSMMGSPAVGLREAGVTSNSPAPASPGASSINGYPFRFSQVQLEYDGTKSRGPEAAFQVTTSTFKNSVYNPAHFGNPSFHPEEWRPHGDSTKGRCGSKKKSRNGSS
jgi:ubiquitin thioesterase protein OTUB1